MTKSIAQSFRDYFEMVPATTEALKEAVYRLRYQVFCLETGFENTDQFPDGLEKDEYDARSEHYLIRHRPTGVYAATTRLILPDPDDIDRPFPIEYHCRLERTDLLTKIPRRCLSEISRFCVSRSFKRRPGETGTLTGVGLQKQRHAVSEDERRTWPHLTLALITCLNKISARHGTTHCYALIEPSLFRLIGFLGIDFTAIGPLTNYHGKRQPCLITVPDYLDRVRKKNVEIWEMLTDYGRLWEESEDAAQPCTCALDSLHDAVIQPTGGSRTSAQHPTKSTSSTNEWMFAKLQD